MSANTAMAQALQAFAAAEPTLHLLDPDAGSLWLRGRLADLQARWSSGQVYRCPHALPGHPAAACLWAPNRLICTACAPELHLTGEAERTCDRCSAVVRKIQSELVLIGTVCVIFGLCAACHAREVDLLGCADR